MSKVSKEFKEEFDTGFSEGAYASRKIITWVVIAILLLSLIFGIIGAVTGFFGKVWDNETSNIAFKQSTTYNEGVVGDLADYRLQYNEAEDDVSRKAIADTVRNRFPNYNSDKIENEDLRNFYNNCMSGIY